MCFVMKLVIGKKNENTAVSCMQPHMIDYG